MQYIIACYGDRLVREEPTPTEERIWKVTYILKECVIEFYHLLPWRKIKISPYSQCNVSQPVSSEGLDISFPLKFGKGAGGKRMCWTQGKEQINWVNNSSIKLADGTNSNIFNESSLSMMTCDIFKNLGKGRLSRSHTRHFHFNFKPKPLKYSASHYIPSTHNGLRFLNPENLPALDNKHIVKLIDVINNNAIQIKNKFLVHEEITKLQLVSYHDVASVLLSMEPRRGCGKWNVVVLAYPMSICFLLRRAWSSPPPPSLPWITLTSSPSGPAAVSQTQSWMTDADCLREKHI